MRVLDAGCGSGRNVVYLLRSGVDVCAVDRSPAAVAAVRELAAELAPELPGTNFRVEPVEAMSFEDKTFDAVLAIALLHFAPDEAQFGAMLTGLWRVLQARRAVLRPPRLIDRHRRPGPVAGGPEIPAS